MLKAALVSFAILLLSCPAGFCEAVVPDLIESGGEAIVETPPDFVEFVLQKSTQSDSVSKAAAASVEFEASLKKYLKDNEIAPAEIVFSKVSVDNIEDPKATVSVRLRFYTLDFTTSSECVKLFGRFCDKLRQMGKAMDASLSGPVFVVKDEASIERAAVERATENAYPNAEAAAGTMRAQIVEIHKLSISSVKWGDSPSWDIGANRLGFKACTAKVRVSYTFSAQEY